MPNVVRFKFIDTPRQTSELARFKVVQGPDFGALYVVVGPQATIGRGEDNDLIISDLKASRNHAVLMRNQIDPRTSVWRVKDSGSANGILHNGVPTREAVIKLGDTITLGETTLEFVTPEAGTKMMTSPARSLGQIQSDQRSLQDRREHLRAGLNSIFFKAKATAAKAVSGAQTKPKGAGLFRNPLVLLLLGGGVLFLLFSGDDRKKGGPAAPTAVNGTDGAQKNGELDSEIRPNLASYLPTSTTSADRSSETLFKEGMREYFLGNYSRAKTQFETVLQINPSHTLANIYLENCKKSIEDEVKLNLENGHKALQAGKLRDARGHFQRVMRLLFRDQTSPGYIESKEQLEKVMAEIAGNSGDIK